MRWVSLLAGALAIAACGNSNSGPVSRTAGDGSAVPAPFASQPAATTAAPEHDPGAIFVRVVEPATRGHAAVRVGRDGRILGRYPDGVISNEGTRLVVVADAAASTPSTRIQLVDSATGTPDTERAVKGAWRLQTMGRDALPVGVAADGTIVLGADRSETKSRFLRLSDNLARDRQIELDGNFTFDAVSQDGGTIYLLEHLSAADETEYRVRSWTGTHGLREGAIVDKRNPGEEMTGYALAQAPAAGEWVYTLYRGDETFIHALETTHGVAFCIDVEDLPPGADEPPADGAWSMVANRSGAVVAINTHVGAIVEADTDHFTQGPTSTFVTASSSATAQLAIDGREAFVPSGADMLAIDMASFETRVVHTASAGIVGTAVLPDGTLVIVDVNGATAFVATGDA